MHRLVRGQEGGCGLGDSNGVHLALVLPTPNGVDLADSIADSAAEAGQPGCSLFHLSRGVLEPGLKAGEGH